MPGVMLELSTATHLPTRLSLFAMDVVARRHNLHLILTWNQEETRTTGALQSTLPVVAHLMGLRYPSKAPVWTWETPRLPRLPSCLRTIPTTQWHLLVHHYLPAFHPGDRLPQLSPSTRHFPDGNHLETTGSQWLWHPSFPSLACSFFLGECCSHLHD